MSVWIRKCYIFWVSRDLRITEDLKKTKKNDEILMKNDARCIILNDKAVVPEIVIQRKHRRIVSQRFIGLYTLIGPN